MKGATFLCLASGQQAYRDGLIAFFGPRIEHNEPRLVSRSCGEMYARIEFGAENES